MTISKMRVHIAPVGYEVDRIVIPATREKADRVWLLLHENRSEDKALPFIKKIESRLESYKIETKSMYHDRRDLFKIIKAVKEVILQEKDNEIYINLASGSKIQAIGTMMAAMMFNDNNNIHPFYVEAETYPGFDAKKPISTGAKEISNVPTYDIKIPDRILVSSLQLISEHKRLTKKEMAKIAVENKLINVNALKGNESQATFASLDKNIIQPLQNKWKLISVEKIGRNHWITLNEEGKNAVKFLI